MAEDIVQMLLYEYTAEDMLYFCDKTGLKLGTAKGEEMERARIARAMKERDLDSSLIAEATKLSADTNEEVSLEPDSAEFEMKRRMDAARLMIREGAKINIVVNVLDLPVDTILQL
jgi:hypothetical protein